MHFPTFSSTGASSSDPIHGQQIFGTLSEAESQAFMVAQKQNRTVASRLMDFLQSDDPGARMPAPQREDLLLTCQNIADLREYVKHNLANEVRGTGTNQIHMTMPLVGHHQSLARQHKIALETVMHQLVANARAQLDLPLADLREAIGHLEAACRALQSPREMSIASQAERLLSQAIPVRQDGMEPPRIAATVRFVTTMKDKVGETANLVRRLVNLEQDLKLRTPGSSPGKDANRDLWNNALEAVDQSRFTDAVIHLNALSRLTSQAPSPRGALHLLGDPRGELDA